MAKKATTTISVSAEVKKAIVDRRGYPGESLDKILRRILNIEQSAPDTIVPPAGEGAKA